jgi:hypothetical protein
MKHKIKLKYDPVNANRVKEIRETHKDQPVLDYIRELWFLIEYQRNLIAEQTAQIVALKHQEGWKRYDKPIENYDPITRKYVDKTPKSGNIN